MRIESTSLARLNPAPYNPRKDLKPGDPEFLKIARSIDEFGLVEPLVWNERSGNLVGGHQRLKVLIERGVEEVEVSVVDLPPEREKALNIALNKVQGDWDPRKLAELLDGLTTIDGFDVTLTGFDLPEVDELVHRFFGPAAEPDAFDLEAALAAIGEPVTKPGDLIRLGERGQHFLLCGDCTDPAQIRRLVEAGGGDKAILFATDPPYLVDYNGTNHPGSKVDAQGRKRSKGGGNKNWSATYGVTWDDADAEANAQLYERFIRVAVDEAILPGAAWYCWHASRRQAMLERAWESAGAFVHAQVIWVKNRGVLTRTWYSWRHEPCFFGWLKGNKPPRTSDESLSTVWEFDIIPNGEQRPDHPTPKPIGLFETPMRQHTKPGDVCYEPFAGSGTQVIAAERLGRRCFAVEISPVYCDLIVRRFMATFPDAVPAETRARYGVQPSEAVP